MLDKNQLYFGVVILSLLTGIGGLLLYNHVTMAKMQNTVNNVSQLLDKFNYNYIQAPHYQLDYMLTNEGFFIRSVNDYGGLNGPSMNPAIFDGNTLLQMKFSLNMTLKPGQIIRYLGTDGTAVIHRVRAVYEDRVFVQGDNMEEGELVSKTSITHVIVGVLFT